MLFLAQTERKISFVLHEPDNEGSEGSSNTTLTLQGEDNAQRRQIPPVRPYVSYNNKMIKLFNQI